MQHTLKVGKSIDLKKNIFSSSIKMYYAGMTSDSVYSLVYSYSSGNRMMAFNLYFPKSRTELDIDKNHLRVLGVSPEEISFQLDN
ncbi:MAG: hypothetical protein GY839_14200 [candidate division Zixibacteria bacterium]|nr:hypothetical protein [candidate division Zixibacteria bacterium]